MQTVSYRQKLHQYIDSIDEQKAEAIYSFFEDENFDIETKRKHLIMEDREEYLKGNNKTLSFDEVKQMAINKEMRSGL